MLVITSSPEDILLNFFNMFLCPDTNIVPQLEYALRTLVLLYD